MALDRNNPAELIAAAREYPLTHDARLSLLIEASAVGIAFLVVQATPSVPSDETNPTKSPVKPSTPPPSKPQAPTAPESVSAPTPRRRSKPKPQDESTNATPTT